MNEVLAAGISGALALVGVIFSNAAAYRRTEQSIRTAQIVTDTKLEELEKEFGFCYQQRIDENRSAVRFCTSWATKEEHVDALIQAIRQKG